MPFSDMPVPAVSSFTPDLTGKSPDKAFIIRQRAKRVKDFSLFQGGKTVIQGFAPLYTILHSESVRKSVSPCSAPCFCRV
jgi:hypothetical protein